MDSTDSILNSVKKLLGLTKDYTAFDQDVIMNINSVFMTLNQIGVGPEKPFVIKGSEETWDQFLSNINQLESVKMYMFMKVRLAFDPPTSSTVLESYKNQIAELEWRLNSAVDFGGKKNE